MIAGRTPFADAQSATAILAAVLTRAPDPLSTYARVPVLLDRIVARCLERDPQSRFTDVGDLIEALAEVAGARHTPAARVNDFAQPVLTTEATRIDVRFSESSQPVLDARGARRRLPDRSDAPAPVAHQRQMTPAPPTVVGNIQGSNNAIDVRGMSPSHGAQAWRPPAVVPIATPLHVPAMQPRTPVPAMQPRTPIPASPVPTLAGGTAPPPPAMPHPAPPAMTPYPAPATPYPAPATPYPAPAMTPYPAPAMTPAAKAVVPVLPGSAMFPAVVPPPMKSPRPFFPIEPTVGAPRYSETFTAVSGYDMVAAASYDKLVRRIIWAAVIIAVIAAAVIALH
jgi:hypothetical protein